MTTIAQRVSMKAILVNDGKVLLLRKANYEGNGGKQGKWNNPGGRVEPGESWQNALEREVSEETGIMDLTIGRPLYVGEWTPVISGVPTQIICMFFLCQTKTTEVILNKEHDRYAWVDPRELADYSLLTPEDAVINENSEDIIAS